MKVVSLFFFGLFFTLTVYSQLDNPKLELKIAPLKMPQGDVSPSSSKSITYPSIFDKKDKLTENFSLLKKEPIQEEIIFDKEKFDSPTEEYTARLNAQMKAEGVSSVVAYSDVFLGDFEVTTKELTISCRDFGAIDGDIVTIWLNGVRVISGVSLDSNYKKVVLELNEGFNVINIEALNTGELYPNTGQFLFIDANQKLITNQQWCLNSGYKAVLKIKKVKSEPKLEPNR